MFPNSPTVQFHDHAALARASKPDNPDLSPTFLLAREQGKKK
jgi:hypothetical protein